MTDEVRKLIAERFPSALWMLNVPEVADLLNQAATEQWSPELFESKLQATNWYRGLNDVQRQRQAQEAINPGQTTQDINTLKEQLKQQAASLGGTLADDRAGALAWSYWRGGFTPQQMKDGLAAEVQPSGVTSNSMNVRQLANKYMIDLPDAQVQDYTRRLFTGELDQNSLTGLFAQQALSQYPTLKPYIDQGVAPGDFFSSYKQMISNLTDTPVDQVDFMHDPQWQKIISTPDPKTGTLRPMTLDEATQYTRNTDAFANSATGQAQAASFFNNFTQALGVRK
jgi:hypothetical protein